jgi:hypothetical protein
VLWKGIGAACIVPALWLNNPLRYCCLVPAFLTFGYRSNNPFKKFLSTLPLKPCFHHLVFNLIINLYENALFKIVLTPVGSDTFKRMPKGDITNKWASSYA